MKTITLPLLLSGLLLGGCALDNEPQTGLPQTVTAEKSLPDEGHWRLKSPHDFAALLMRPIDPRRVDVVLAALTSDLHDATGERVLLPAGTRLAGQFGVFTGEGKATRHMDDRSFILINWERVYLPEGACLMLRREDQGCTQPLPEMTDQFAPLFSIITPDALAREGLRRLVVTQLGAEYLDPLLQTAQALPLALQLPPGRYIRVLTARPLILEPYAGDGVAAP